MSVAELVPSSAQRISDPEGSVLQGRSLRERSYRMRRDGVGMVLPDILRARGIERPEEFLEASLKGIPDPFVLKDMDVACSRLADAIMRRERILVFGDYDVDGACSSAILHRFVEMVGGSCTAYIPDRFEDGYGPSLSALAKCSPSDFDLVVFVDCGTASGEIIDGLRTDVIVVDHHKQQGDLPQVVACVNPHRLDDDSGLDMVCAAGLVFMLCVATRRTLRARGFFMDGQPDLRDLLDLAALATVSDVVPLVGLSRILVASGLEAMRRGPSVGVSALMSAAGVEEPSAGRIGFGLGPRINAAGRVGGGTSSSEGALGFELLSCRDANRAAEIASRLNELNAERQAVEKKVLDEAMEQAAVQAEAGAQILCLRSEGWHQGVIGIVAGRVREKFGIPAIVAAVENGNAKGSGRSVPGFDLGGLVIEARSRGLLAGGGGHSMACGLSLPVADWDKFVAFAEAHAAWSDVPIAVDCIESISDVSMEAVSELDLLEPVGQGNPSPVAVFTEFHVKAVKPFGKGHVRLLSRRSDVEALFWRAEDDGILADLEGLLGSTVSLVGVARVDEWQGRRKISINASDIIF